MNDLSSALFGSDDIRNDTTGQSVLVRFRSKISSRSTIIMDFTGSLCYNDTVPEPSLALGRCSFLLDKNGMGKEDRE